MLLLIKSIQPHFFHNKKALALGLFYLALVHRTHIKLFLLFYGNVGVVYYRGDKVMGIILTYLTANHPAPYQYIKNHPAVLLHRTLRKFLESQIVLIVDSPNFDLSLILINFLRQ